MLYVIFGAPDPEREAAMEVARDAGVGYGEAVCDGQPISAESAYRATAFHPREGELHTGDTVLLFECGGDLLRRRLEGHTVRVLDHHRPGDTGYGRPPHEFLAASSLGQLIACLAEAQRLPPPWRRIPPPDAFDWCVSAGSVAFGYYTLRPGAGQWLLFDESLGTWPAIPQHYVFAAAADHCLSAAYRGLCPGVEPDALMRWRVESRAAFQRRDPESLLADVERAREVLRTAPRIDLGGELVADLRGRLVAELPEAAAREGAPFIATPPVRPGERQKVVLQCAGPAALAAWPAWAREQGLVDLYGGDPARGFAGAYMT